MTLPSIRSFNEFNEWRAAEHRCEMWHHDDPPEWIAVCAVCGEIGRAPVEMDAWGIGAGHVMLMRAISPENVNKR